MLHSGDAKLASPAHALPDWPFAKFFNLTTNMRITAPPFWEWKFSTSQFNVDSNFGATVANGNPQRTAGSGSYSTTPLNELQLREFQLSTKFIYELDLLV